jgi:hypothetical protein
LKEEENTYSDLRTHTHNSLNSARHISKAVQTKEKTKSKLNFLATTKQNQKNPFRNRNKKYKFRHLKEQKEENKINFKATKQTKIVFSKQNLRLK